VSEHAADILEHFARRRRRLGNNVRTRYRAIFWNWSDVYFVPAFPVVPGRPFEVYGIDCLLLVWFIQHHAFIPGS
jgi:hypothetical protein